MAEIRTGFMKPSDGVEVEDIITALGLLVNGERRWLVVGQGSPYIERLIHVYPMDGLDRTPFWERYENPVSQEIADWIIEEGFVQEVDAGLCEAHPACEVRAFGISEKGAGYFHLNDLERLALES